MLIYMVRNLVNGKVYVGRSKQNSCKARWQVHVSHAFDGQHKSPFIDAIREFGPEAFAVSELAKAQSEQELVALERIWIERLHACDPQFGYNISTGERAKCKWNHTPEAREKMREAKLREKNPFFGKKHTEEARRKQGEAASHPFTDEHKRKISEALRGANNPMFGKSVWAGRKHSEETKRKLSENKKLLWQDEAYREAELKRRATGHSEETKRKIGEASRKRMAN